MGTANSIPVDEVLAALKTAARMQRLGQGDMQNGFMGAMAFIVMKHASERDADEFMGLCFGTGPQYVEVLN